jgi:hypothetical protein
MQKPEEQKTTSAIMREKVLEEYHAYKKFLPKRAITLEKIKTDIPKLFEGIPLPLQQAIADYSEFKFGADAIQQLQKLDAPNNARSFYAFKWMGLGFAYKILPYQHPEQAYFHFVNNKDEKSLFNGFRYHTRLRDYCELDQKLQKLIQQQKQLEADLEKAQKSVLTMLPIPNKEIEAKKESLANYAKSIKKTSEQKDKMMMKMVQEYKIHLMPIGDPTPVIVHLINALATDKELSYLINMFKVSPNPNYITSFGTVARIVIYPAAGKKLSQIALNKIYELFKGVKGLDERPRFDVKVNDLIWVAQGESSEKSGCAGDYFETPQKAFYNPNVTGSQEDYHLKHPETGKELT